MADVEVREAELQVRTVKLTKALLKQMRKLSYTEVKHLIENGTFKDGVVVGWIHGSVFNDEFRRFLLLNLSDGDYGLVEAGILSDGDCKKYKQLYI